VEFTIAAPQPELLTAAIDDDRVLAGKLFLDLRLLQNTQGDTFNVDVDWAKDPDGGTLTQHYTVQCADAGSDTCDTGPLLAPNDAPTNANWSQSPSFRIPDADDYLPFVTVHITNGFGNEITRTFPIVGDNRPRYAETTPTVTMAAGATSSVDVTQVFPSPLLTDSQDLTIQPYFAEMLQHLPAGVTPDIEQRNGDWFLTLHGQPNADAIGTYTFSFPFEQEPQGSGFKPAPALVTLNVAASTGPGYRALLKSVPEQLADRAYRNVYPDYGVQVAQTLAPSDTGFTPFTGTVHCRLVTGPLVVFDKPCQADHEFPWPTGRVSGLLNASVYVTSNTQPVSSDPAYQTSLITKFLDPEITQQATKPADLTTTFTMRLYDDSPVQPPFNQSGYDVTCHEDGGSGHTCLNGGTLTLPRTPGAHELVVRVTAPDHTMTTEHVAWNVATPAHTLAVSVPAGDHRAGSQMKVDLGRMLPHESYVVTIGDHQVAKGKAGLDGTAVETVAIPQGLAAGKHTVKVVGATKQRTGEHAVHVVRPSRRILSAPRPRMQLG
jgi:hypothetical protein